MFGCMAIAKNEANESAIRALIDERMKPVRNKSAEDLVAHTASDVLTFDVVKPLRNVGTDAMKKRAERWWLSIH